MTPAELTDAELGAIYHEVAEDDGPVGDVARALMELAAAVGIDLPAPATSWGRDALVESARRKVDGDPGEAWRGE